jgi:hypothetical protein
MYSVYGAAHPAVPYVALIFEWHNSNFPILDFSVLFLSLSLVYIVLQVLLIEAPSRVQFKGILMPKWKLMFLLYCSCLFISFFPVDFWFILHWYSFPILRWYAIYLRGAIYIALLEIHSCNKFKRGQEVQMGKSAVKVNSSSNYFHLKPFSLESIA